MVKNDEKRSDTLFRVLKLFHGHGSIILTSLGITINRGDTTSMQKTTMIVF